MKLFLRSILFFTIASFAPLAFAQSVWTGGAADGQWASDANWDPAGEPSGNALINESTTIALPGGPTTVGDLEINNGTVTLNATTSTFTANLINVRNSGILNLNIPATGVVTTTNSDFSNFIGDATGTGTFTLTGAGTLDLVSIPNHGTCVGIGGMGAFIQSGSTTVIIGNALFIGADGNFAIPSSIPAGSTTANGGNGTYTLSGSASLSSDFIEIGIGSGTGGGTTTGGATPTTGLLNINGGTVTAASMDLGINGDDETMAVTTTSGSVNQTAGDVNIDDLEVGVSSGATASYGISGGTIGATTVGTDIVIGVFSGSTGTFQQASGSTVETQNLVVGDEGTGTYLLQGGTLTVDTELNIGGTTGNGTLTQSSGSTLITNGAFNIGTDGGTGVFNYNGGTLTLSSGITVGATGTLNQNTSVTWTTANPVTIDGGTYNLNAGTLSVGGDMGTAGSSGLFTTGTGNFNFAGGTVAVTGTDWTDPLDGILSGRSTIDTTGGNATLSGNLSGSGALDIIGGQTVNLTGTASTGSWGATISADSILTAASTAALSTTGTYLIGSGSTFTIGSTGPGPDTFAGNISDFSDPLDPAGTANFNTGTNKLVLSGQTDLSVNSVTTIGAGGSLEVDKGIISNVDGSAGNVADTFDVGNGVSTGTVQLLGTNNFGTGLATVNAGSTLLAGDITGNVSVLTGATLGTLGTLNVPATLSLHGTLTSTGTLLIHTNGVTADKFGSLTSANLSGLVNVIGIGTITNAVIVDTTGGVTATVGTAPGDLTTNPATALFSSTLTNTGTQLLLSTVQNPLSGFAQTPNEAAVAGSLDNVITGGAPFPNAFLPVLTALNRLSAGAIPGALEELTPESLQYSRMISFENSNMLAIRMNGVDADLRGGYGGLDTNAISVVTPGFNSDLGRSLGSLLAYNDPAFHQTAPNGVNYYPGGDSGSSPSSSSTSAPTWNSSNQVISDSPNPYMATQAPSGPETPGFSEFIGGDAVLADLNQNQSGANAPSSKANYTAVDATAGVSFRMTSHLAAGVLFNYNHTDAKTDASDSKTHVDTYSPGLFATYFDHGFYANGLFSFGYNNYDNTRNIGFLGETASSHPSGQQYVGDLDFGYDFHPNKCWVVGPTLGVTYTHLDIDSFTESGAPGANLGVDSQSADSLRSRLGGHVVFQTNTGDVLLQPNISAMWQHEYLDNGSGITSSFSDFSSNSFTIQTAAPSRDSALISVGLTATLNNSMAFYLNYLTDVGADNYFAQSVVGGFKARF